MADNQPDDKLRLDRVHALYNLLSFEHDDFESIYNTYLEKGLQILGQSLGIIARVRQGEYTILAISPGFAGMEVGDVLQVELTYSTQVIQENAVVSFDHISQHTRMKHHPAYQRTLLESYIAAPIWVKGDIYGVLSFSSEHPRVSPFTKQDHEFISLMAQGIGSMLTQDLLYKEKQQAMARMLESAALFESAFQHAAIGMALVAPDGRWHKVNQSLIDLLGYTEEELLALDFQTITHSDDLANGLELLNELVAGKRVTYQIEKRYITREGDAVWTLLNVSAVYNGDGSIKYFVSQMQNINERKQAEKLLREKQRELSIANVQLMHQASQDALTGIDNRRRFVAYYHEEIGRMICHPHPVPISLAILDIDNFKTYNDEFGHLEGDNALRRVAQLLDSDKREQDKLARFGGEEFTLLFPATDSEGCLAVCERLRYKVAEIENLARPLTISLGCVTFMPHDDRIPTLDEMIRQADECLYEAKRQGRNQVRHREFVF